MQDTSVTSKPYKFPNPSKTRPAILPQLAIKPWLQGHAPSLALKNCKVVDPALGALLDGLRTIIIQKGRIVSIESDDAHSLEDKPEDVREVDLKGKFVCPGLIDCHVHVTAVPGVKNMSELVNIPDELTHLRSTYILSGMIRRGFTTVRDTGGATKLLATAIDEGLIEGPRLIQCGKALSQTGGHGDFSPGVSGGSGVGCCGGHSQSLGRVVDGVPNCLKAAREEIKAGADFLKIMVGGGVASETDTIESLQYTAEEIKAVTTTATQMGNKLVTAHAYTTQAIRHAVDNGCRGIEHGNLMDKDCAIMMAAKGIYLTPTLSCYGAMARPPFEDFLSPDGQIKNEQVMEHGLEAIKMAEEAGVTICYGSDLLTSLHALQTEEFTVRATVLDSPTVLRHATTNGAKMLGKSGLLGTISPAAYADILILNRNPLEDIKVLDRPELYLKAVLKEGKVIFSSVDGL